MPKVSFVVPAFKVEKFLPRCLDSILSQTFTDWEAICVNDGSPDRCLEIMRSYADRDSRFVVIDKENGGLSDARNAGVKAATGDYVVFVDSDDFIHPQTLELACAIQNRSGAQIVSWYKDRSYRNKLYFQMLIHRDPVLYKPSSYFRRFNPEKVRYNYTGDIISVSTEMSHPVGGHREWIKHCYVWRHMIERSLLDGIEFEKGLSFEDFPWWSAVLLKNPTAAFTRLPFYYYFVNFQSIDKASPRDKKVRSWVRGLEISLALYESRADEHQYECWIRNFMWPVLNHQISRHLVRITPESQYYGYIRDTLLSLDRAGKLDNPPCDCFKCARERIRRFLYGR